MSRILEARVVPYALPLSSPWRTATGERRSREGALLVLRGPAAAEGLGEAAPLPGRTETLGACLAALERAAAQLPGTPVDGALERLEASHPELRAVPGGARAARAAVSTALFDLRSRLADRSLAGWLSDRFGDAREPARGVPVNASLPLAPVEETVEAARKAVAAGYRTLKLKLGHGPREVGRVRAVRDAVGPHVALRVDANGAWRPEEALEWLEALAPLGIEYVEQPLPAGAGRDRGGALAALAALRRRSPVPLAADESADDPRAVGALLEAAAADVLVLKPAVLGGPDVALRAARRAREAGVVVVVTSALDGVVGRLAALHVAAALGPGLPPCGLATGAFLLAEVAEGDEALEGGWLTVPDGPGLGARLRRQGAAS